MTELLQFITLVLLLLFWVAASKAASRSERCIRSIGAYVSELDRERVTAIRATLRGLDERTRSIENRLMIYFPTNEEQQRREGWTP